MAFLKNTSAPLVDESNEVDEKYYKRELKNDHEKFVAECQRLSLLTLNPTVRGIIDGAASVSQSWSIASDQPLTPDPNSVIPQTRASLYTMLQIRGFYLEATEHEEGKIKASTNPVVKTVLTRLDQATRNPTSGFHWFDDFIINSIMDALIRWVRGEVSTETLKLLQQQRSYRGGPIERVRLDNADLVGADLSGMDLRDACFYGADLSGANLNRCLLSTAVLDKARFRRATFDDAELVNVSAHSADFSNASFKGAKIEHLYHEGAKWNGANLTDAHIGFLTPEFSKRKAS